MKLVLFRSFLTFLLLGMSMSMGAAIPRAEHPRPDAFRANWMSLNGDRQFEIDEKADGDGRGLRSGKDLATNIIVPFCPESSLSGIGNTAIMKHTWYRRLFAVPATGNSASSQAPGKSPPRILLHFGAVDYQAWVWVNGQPAGSQVGGSASFNFDITKVLRPGVNELVVHVFDDTASANQPAGKQTFTVSQGCVSMANASSNG